MKEYKHVVIMRKIASEIRENSLKILVNGEALQRFHEQLAIQETAIKNGIWNALDDNGNPLYSNEAKRKTAISDAMQQSKEIERLNANINSLESSASSIAIENSYLNKLYEISLKHADFILQSCRELSGVPIEIEVKEESNEQ